VGAPAVQLFLGESLLRERAFQGAIQRLRSQADLGAHVLEAGSVTAAGLEEFLFAPSLFEPGCWVLLRRADELKDPKALVALLERGLPERTYLLLEADKLDKRGALYKWIKAHGQVHEFESLKRNTLPGQLKRLLDERGVRLDREGFQYLIGAVPQDLRAIAGEVDKLALYAQGESLGLEQVQGLAFGGQQADVFAFLDACGAREREALHLLQRLLDSGEEASKLFYMLANHMRALLAIRALLDEGLSQGQIAPRVGLAPWMVNRRIPQAKRWRQAELTEALCGLHGEDVRLKRGERDPDAALLALVIRWTGAGVASSAQ